MLITFLKNLELVFVTTPAGFEPTTSNLLYVLFMTQYVTDSHSGPTELQSLCQPFLRVDKYKITKSLNYFHFFINFLM